jgi:hypothetical protein
MRQYYDPNEPNRYEDEYEEDSPTSYASRADNLFHVGQTYEGKPVDTLYCLSCGGNEFNVGQGSYITAIRCIKCGWEASAHEG